MTPNYLRVSSVYVYQCYGGAAQDGREKRACCQGGSSFAIYAPTCPVMLTGTPTVRLQTVAG